MVAINMTSVVFVDPPVSQAVWWTTQGTQNAVMPALALLNTLVAIVGTLFTVLSATRAQSIVLTNDDGWAVAQIRAEFNALEAAGFQVGFGTLLSLQSAPSRRLIFRCLVCSYRPSYQPRRRSSLERGLCLQLLLL